MSSVLEDLEDPPKSAISMLQENVFSFLLQLNPPQRYILSNLNNPRYYPFLQLTFGILKPPLA
jgi:hypothetical protein